MELDTTISEFVLKYIFEFDYFSCYLWEVKGLRNITHEICEHGTEETEKLPEQEHDNNVKV